MGVIRTRMLFYLTEQNVNFDINFIADLHIVIHFLNITVCSLPSADNFSFRSQYEAVMFLLE